MTFDLDIWHDGSLKRYLGHIHRSMSQAMIRVQGHRRKMFPFRLKVKEWSGKTSSGNMEEKQTWIGSCKK